MITISLTKEEAKNTMEFIEVDFPSFIKEGELNDLDYIGNVANTFKKLKCALNNLSNDENKDRLDYDEEVYGKGS